MRLRYLSVGLLLWVVLQCQLSAEFLGEGRIKKICNDRSEKLISALSGLICIKSTMSLNREIYLEREERNSKLVESSILLCALISAGILILIFHGLIGGLAMQSKIYSRTWRCVRVAWSTIREFNYHFIVFCFEIAIFHDDQLIMNGLMTFHARGSAIVYGTQAKGAGTSDMHFQLEFSIANCMFRMNYSNVFEMWE